MSVAAVAARIEKVVGDGPDRPLVRELELNQLLGGRSDRSEAPLELPRGGFVATIRLVMKRNRDDARFIGIWHGWAKRRAGHRGGGGRGMGGHEPTGKRWVDERDGIGKFVEYPNQSIGTYCALEDSQSNDGVEVLERAESRACSLEVKGAG